MVGPSLTDEERRLANNRLKIGFIGLVSISMGLMAVQLDSSTTELIAAVVGGAVIGAVLLWFVLWNFRTILKT